MDNCRHITDADFLHGKMHQATEVSEVEVLTRRVIEEAKP